MSFPQLAVWKQRQVLKSLGLVAFWCPAWLLATGTDGHKFPVVPCHFCHFYADALGTPGCPKWHRTPTFRQVKRAAGKCPPWQSVATDALSERSKAIWAGGLMGLLPGYCCGCGGRKVAKVRWEGVLRRKEGTDVAARFHVATVLLED